MATYVVSDLHGYHSVFQKGLEKIAFSEKDRLYVIGDAIDRGPDGIAILTMIKKNANMELLLGNHEFMMLNSVAPNGDAVCSGPDSNVWLYYNGGTTTFETYMQLPDEERMELLEWLRKRYLIKTLDINGKAICLTHSYYDADCVHKRYEELSYRAVCKVVWMSIYRDDYETHGEDIYGNYDYTFVTGHVPVQRVRRWHDGVPDYNKLEIHSNGNLIDIDGGLAMGDRAGVNNGALFLRLEDMMAFSIPI